MKNGKAIGAALGCCLLVTSVAGITGCDNDKPVNVEKVVDTIELDTTKAKKTFALGEAFSYEGLVVSKKFKEGDPEKTKDFTVDSSAYKKDIAGEYEITVTLDGTNIKTTYKVTVEKGKELTGIKINTDAVKKSFAFGEPFTSEGLKVEKVFNKGENELTNDYTVDSSKYNKDVAGTYTITVTLDGTDKVDTYKVTVAEQIVIQLHPEIVESPMVPNEIKKLGPVINNINDKGNQGRKNLKMGLAEDSKVEGTELIDLKFGDLINKYGAEDTMPVFDESFTYFLNVAKIANVEDVESLTLNGVTYTKDSINYASVGHNYFIASNVFKFDKDTKELSIIAPILVHASSGVLRVRVNDEYVETQLVLGMSEKLNLVAEDSITSPTSGVTVTRDDNQKKNNTATIKATKAGPVHIDFNIDNPIITTTVEHHVDDGDGNWHTEEEKVKSPMFEGGGIMLIKETTIDKEGNTTVAYGIDLFADSPEFWVEFGYDMDAAQMKEAYDGINRTFEIYAIGKNDGFITLGYDVVVDIKA